MKQFQSSQILQSLSQSTHHQLCLGDCLDILPIMETDSAHLIFTSPPYFNARPDHGHWDNYRSYLQFMTYVIHECTRVLKPGRIFAINTSPIIIPREKRSESSVRYPIPYDIHHFFMNEGYEFLEDIIWEKPAGAAPNRNAQFSRHRKPLAYKPNIVTESIMIYRKPDDNRLIDHIIDEYDDETIQQSLVKGEYEKTNVWYIQPETDEDHDAIFPLELASKIIRYYSFVGDRVLDPFSGTGTVGYMAARHNRLFSLIENNPTYIDRLAKEIPDWVGKERLDQVDYINCEPFQDYRMLF